MMNFWKLASLFLGLGAFFLTGIILLIEGEPFHIVVIKAVVAFIALTIVQNMLGGILVSVVESHQAFDENEAGTQPPDAQEAVQNQG